MEFINALIDLYKAALGNQDFVNNLASFWGTLSGLMAFKRKADWQERFSWLITGYFFSRYGGQLLVSWLSILSKIEEPLRFFMAMFFSFILALLVKVFEYVGGDPKFIPAIVMALLPSFIANKLQSKNDATS
jgi:hypothetical protein